MNLVSSDRATASRPARPRLQRRLTLANVGVVGLFVAAAARSACGAAWPPRVVVALGGYASVPRRPRPGRVRVPIVVMEQNKRPASRTASRRGSPRRSPCRSRNAVAARRRHRQPCARRSWTSTAKVRRGARTVIRARHWWLVGRDAHQRRCARARPALGDACRSRRPSCRWPSQHRSGARERALASDRRPAVRDRRLRGRHADRDGSRRRRRLPRELGPRERSRGDRVPSVLVPWSGGGGSPDCERERVARRRRGGGDHRRAEWRTSAVSARVVARDPARLDSMARACKEVARPDAAQRVADLVEEQARG